MFTVAAECRQRQVTRIKAFRVKFNAELSDKKPQNYPYLSHGPKAEH